MRWQLLLEPVGKINLLQAIQAIYAGLFTNEVLPMRPGEFVRSYIASRRVGAGFVTILPSIILERLFDGVWIAMGIGLAAIFAPLPEDLIEAGEMFVAVIALFVAFFIYLVLRRPSPRRSGRQADRGLPRWKPLRAIAGLFKRLSEGLRDARPTSLPIRIDRTTSGSLCRAITARMASSTIGRAITVCNCGPTLIVGCWRWWDSGWLEWPMQCFRETGDEVIANNAWQASA